MLQSTEARTGTAIGEAWPESTAAEIAAAVQSAADAAAAFGATGAVQRATLLRALAGALEAEREALVALADRESGLGLPRLNGELDRTAFQLRGFADVLERGDAHVFIDDAAVAGAPPAGRPRLTRVRVRRKTAAMRSRSSP